MNDPTTNQPDALSVSELSQKLKRTLEQQFDFVRIRGELSKVKIHTSGHLYTDLKDENAVINAVCWRGTVSQLSIKPEEGLEVICTGKITTYPARSNYQLVIESMELAGQGALLKMLEERKKKLQAEGLFDATRKHALPFLPTRIGIITSPTGAVIQDMLHRLGDRFPRSVLLWPANVQGENAVRDVLAGIKAFHAFPADQRPDVLIIARGGGSLEDLMPFNDELLVRAVAASEIPVIAAIGHETDVTLIELVADRRAPTPTAAAEMAVPVRADLIYTLTSYRQRLDTSLHGRIKHDALHLRNLTTALGDPMKIISTQQQRIDFAGMSLLQALTRHYSQVSNRFSRIQSALRHPQLQIDLAVQKLKGVSALLESYSFKNVLARGFALVTDKDGHVVSSAKQARTHSSLKLTFADDAVTVKPE
jgi:exodeoxyribonuclease VII large subunit